MPSTDRSEQDFADAEEVFRQNRRSFVPEIRVWSVILIDALDGAQRGSGRDFAFLRSEVAKELCGFLNIGVSRLLQAAQRQHSGKRNLVRMNRQHKPRRVPTEAEHE